MAHDWPMKIYCEPGALSKELRAHQHAGRIKLVHFPYDPDSRSRAVAPSAVLSDAQWRDLNTTWEELGGTWEDMKGSEHLTEISRIVDPSNRRDALHLDSAYKTGCAAFVTVDRDILDHRDELEQLLSIRIFHPELDKTELDRFIAAAAPLAAAELRTRIRKLIASGVLPKDPPPITRPGPTSTPGTRRSKTVVGGPHQEPCAICGEPGPQIQHFYIAAQVVRVHGACDTLWQLERAHGAI